MISKNRLVMLAAGILLILAMARGPGPTPALEADGIAPAYEPRSFDDVKPQNVDLKLVPAPPFQRSLTATSSRETFG